DQLFFDRTMAFTAGLDDAYRSLTREQVNAAIARHLAPARLSVVAAGDFSAAAVPTPATGDRAHTPAVAMRRRGAGLLGPPPTTSSAPAAPMRAAILRAHSPPRASA